MAGLEAEAMPVRSRACVGYTLLPAHVLQINSVFIPLGIFQYIRKIKGFETNLLTSSGT